MTRAGWRCEHSAPHRPWPIAERYRLIKAAGFDGVMLWWGTALERGDYRAGPGLARQAGRTAENAHAPFQYQDLIRQGNLGNLSHVLAEVESPRPGFCHDCGHNHRYCPEADLPARYAARLAALRLHDYGADNNPHRLPFDGAIDWLEAMGRLARAGYSSPVCIEAMNWGYEHLTAEQFVRAAFERGQKLLACATQ